MNIWLQSELPEMTEVVVIGGGIAGMSAALSLANGGVDVVLLEAGEIAGRASGRNDGQVLLGMGEPYNRIVSQFGVKDASILLNFIRENNASMQTTILSSLHGDDAIYGGGLHLAETKQEVTELQISMGLLLDENVMCHWIDETLVNDRLQSKGFKGGLRITGESIIHPAKTVKVMQKLARDNGAAIHAKHEVIRVIKSDDGYHIHLDDGRSIHTVMVVHCTSALARNLDESGFLKAQIFPYRGQIIVTEHLGYGAYASLEGMAMSSNFGYEYFRIYEGRFMIGGMRWTINGQEENTLDDTIINSVISDKLMEYVRKYFPLLASAKFIDAWTGIIAGTKDGLPLVGEIPGQTGSFVLAAFNGYGLGFAYKAGQMIADQIIDGKSNEEAARLFNPRRFLS